MPTSADIYRSLLKVLVSQNRWPQALEIAEQCKNRAFRELLQSYLPGQPNFEFDFSTLNFNPAFTLDELCRSAQEKQTTFVYYGVIYDEGELYRFYPFTKPLNPLGYPYPWRLLIWLVNPQGELHFHTVDLQQFLALEKTSLSSLIRQICEFSETNFGAEGEWQSYQNNLKILYQLLIAPIAHYLPSDPEKMVTLLPQDFLYTVPFGALMDGDGQYFCDRHTFNIVPALGFLRDSPAQDDRLDPPKNLVFGNPTMPSLCLPPHQDLQHLPHLPQAEQEAKAIAPLLQCEAITGSMANRPNLLKKIRKARFVHLATYGFLSLQGGFSGAIALAPTFDDHGILTILDILKLSLRAQVLTISISYPRQGSIWGNGLESLGRVCLYGGAKNLLLPLWHGDPESNQRFFSQFYGALQQNQTPPQAWRSAMFKTRETFSHPRHWATFTLISRRS